MKVFDALFNFLWSLLEMSVSIEGYRFSLGGAVIFATIIIVFIAFLKWLFSAD